MRYAARVDSCLKGCGQVDLGQKVLISGPNGSGKSAIPGAVELALSRRVSDVTGRDSIANPGDLIALAPGREGELYSEVVLSDGARCVFRTSGGGGRGKKGDHRLPDGVDPERVFPLRRVKEALLGAPATTRAFFFAEVCRGIADSDVLRALPVPYHEQYTALIGPPELHPGEAPVDALLRALEEAGKRQREAAAASKAADATATAMGQGLAPDAPAADVDAAAQRLAAARRHLESALREHERLRVAHAHVGFQQERARALDETRLHLAEWKARLADLERLGAAPAGESADAVAARAARIAALLTVVQLHVARAATECVLCGAATTPAALRLRATQVAEAVAGLEARDALSRHANDARQAIGNLVRQEEAYVEALRQGNAITGSVVLVEGPPSTTAIDEARASVATLEQAHVALAHTRTSWEGVRRAQGLVATKAAEASEWERCAAALRKVVRDLLDARVAGFVAHVQSFLPPGDRFHLRLREGDRDVCQYGLLRPGSPNHPGVPDVLHTALSGSEWARVTLAMSAAISANDDLAILVLEDRAFDAPMLKSVLEALASYPGQVFVTTPLKPPRVRGWTVIKRELPAGAAAPAETEDGAGVDDGDVFTATNAGGPSLPPSPTPAFVPVGAPGGAVHVPAAGLVAIEGDGAKVGNGPGLRLV